MNSLKKIEKIQKLINEKKFDYDNILNLYKNLFDEINFENQKEFNAILKISDKLIEFFLSKHKYETVLELYKIEHRFFSKLFNDIYSKQLEKEIKKTKIGERGLKDILDYLLISFDVIKSRWKEIIFDLEKLDDKRINKIVEKKMKPLLFKSNFHIIHTVHFLKHNYSELEKVYKKISELSLVDTLTGLKNRRYFLLTYENLFYMANRSQLPICFIMMDIDDFKKVNDSYGHQKGDEVLIKIALLISNFFRRSDIIIRFGGDEILIILVDVNSYDVKLLIEQFLKRISEIKFDYEDSSFSVTMSAGISCEKVENCFKPAILKNKLLKQADMAMYESKRKGKNRTTIYEKNL